MYSFSPLHETLDIFRHFMKCLTSRIACNMKTTPFPKLWEKMLIKKRSRHCALKRNVSSGGDMITALPYLTHFCRICTELLPQKGPIACYVSTWHHLPKSRYGKQNCLFALASRIQNERQLTIMFILSQGHRHHGALFVNPYLEPYLWNHHEFMLWLRAPNLWLRTPILWLRISTLRTLEVG